MVIFHSYVSLPEGNHPESHQSNSGLGLTIVPKIPMVSNITFPSFHEMSFHWVSPLILAG